jgi:hypothetical protein
MERGGAALVKNSVKAEATGVAGADEEAVGADVYPVRLRW